MQLNLKTSQKVEYGTNKVRFSSNSVCSATAMKHTFLRLEDLAVDGEMEQFVVLATNTHDLIVIKDK